MLFSTHWSVNKRVSRSLLSVFSIFFSILREDDLFTFLKHNMITLLLRHLHHPSITSQMKLDLQTYRNKLALSPIITTPFSISNDPVPQSSVAFSTLFTLCHCLCCFFHLGNIPRPQCFTITVLFTFGRAEWHDMSSLKLLFIP